MTTSTAPATITAAEPTRFSTLHSTVVPAPAAQAWALLADATCWPAIFPPTVHVERLDSQPNAERLQLWALANGQLRTWTSWRAHQPEQLQVSFFQEVPAAPLASMSGAWQVRADGPARCTVLLHHTFSVLDDDPHGIELVQRAVDRNSTSELAALAAAAQPAPGEAEVHLDFSDTVEMNAPPAQVYDFLARADLWPQRLPHVDSLELTEQPGGLQAMRMGNRAPDGSVHTTESVRVCLPHRLIAYKQTRPPALMAQHLGRWQLEALPQERTSVTSHHQVVLRPESIADVLGAGTTTAQARRRVRQALSTNSRTTLQQAKAYTEAHRPR